MYKTNYSGSQGGTSIAELRRMRMEHRNPAGKPSPTDTDIPVWKSNQQPVWSEDEMASLARDIEGSLPSNQRDVAVSEPPSHPSYPASALSSRGHNRVGDQDAPLVIRSKDSGPMVKSKEGERGVKNVHTGYLSYVPSFLREPVVIFLIYYLFSIEPIQKLIATQITQMKPDESGKVPYIGIAIYGMIVTLAIMLGKRLLI